MTNIGSVNHQRALYLKGRKGYYSPAFSTQVTNATELDLTRSTTYALNLVSSFEKIPTVFLYFVEKSEKDGLSYHLSTYYVYVGKMVIGKIYIKEQKLLKSNNLFIDYRKKIDSREYKESYHIKPKVSNKGKNYTRQKKYTNRRQSSLRLKKGQQY